MRVAVGCILALFAVEASGAATWIRVSSPSIQLFTDCGEKTARTILHRFDTLQRVFGESRIAASPAPLLVFVFASAEEYEKYRGDTFSVGMFRSTGDEDLIALYQGDALQRVVSHEYLHAVVAHASAPLPVWMVEGVPEFYSTLSVSGNKIHIGEPIPSHQRVLAAKPWMNPDDMALGNPGDNPVFYAESWALVHMLTLAPAWSKGMPQFVKLLNEGREQKEAFTTAFGKSMGDALTALHGYLRFPRELTAPAPPMESAPVYEVTTLSAVDATLALADLALRTDHLDLARTLSTRAARENPEVSRRGRGAGRSGAWPSIATKTRSANWNAPSPWARATPTAYFQLALMKNDRPLLEKTLTIDPHFSQAHFLLGVRETDDGNFASPPLSICARRAVAVQPRRFTYWNALGYAQAKSGDRPGAAEAARRATLIASTPQEEKMAAALTLLASETPAAVIKKPEVTTPPSWQNRKGDARAEGILTRVDCEASPVRLVFSTGAPARTIELKVLKPNEVELVNASGVSTTLSCGEQSQAVAVEYIAASGEITRIEFKRDIKR